MSVVLTVLRFNIAKLPASVTKSTRSISSHLALRYKSAAILQDSLRKIFEEAVETVGRDWRRGLSPGFSFIQIRPKCIAGEDEGNLNKGHQEV